MPELDKVINGLKACLTYPDKCTGDCTTDLCQYRGGDCHSNLLNDALALLEAERPRVLTLGEVRNLKNEDVVYLEDFDKSDLLVGVFYSVNLKITNVSFYTSKGRIYPDTKDDYGKRWRCWNIKPTDEQRNAEKWDA